jgi:short-subunit dehydrogenase
LAWDIRFQVEFLGLSKKKIIVITGTSKGIGNELAKIYLSKNFFVYGCSRSQNTIFNKNYSHKILDISLHTNLIKWISGIIKNKKIDKLILNAATIKRSLFIFENLKNIKKSINTNYLSNILLVRLVLQQMIKNKSGTIVFFSSISTITKDKGTAIYSSAKSGVENLMEILSKELKSFNINFLIFKISYILTDMSKTLNNKEFLKITKKVHIKKITNVKKISQIIDKNKKCKNKNFFLIKDEFK